MYGRPDVYEWPASKHSGSGKTLAYVLPLLATRLKRGVPCQALVVCPSRDVATQLRAEVSAPEAAAPCVTEAATVCQRLQPYVPEAATVCARGCNRVPEAATVRARGCNRVPEAATVRDRGCNRVPEAATVCARGCNRMCQRLQP